MRLWSNTYWSTCNCEAFQNVFHFLLLSKSGSSFRRICDATTQFCFHLFFHSFFNSFIPFIHSVHSFHSFITFIPSIHSIPFIHSFIPFVLSFFLSSFHSFFLSFVPQWITMPTRCTTVQVKFTTLTLLRGKCRELMYEENHLMFRYFYLVLCAMNDLRCSCFRLCDDVILTHTPRACVLQVSALCPGRCYPGPFISEALCPWLRFVPSCIVCPASSIFTSSV